jgi:hypothetical protein
VTVGTGDMVVQADIWEEALTIAKIRGCDPATLINSSKITRVFIPREGQDTKSCSGCKATWTISSFSKNRKAKDGHLGECKQCVYEKSATYHAKVSRKISTEADVVKKELKKELKKEIKNDLIGTKDKVTRTRWPIDKKKRMTALKKVLPTALRDYDGQEAQISVALMITIEEIREAIASSEDLQRLYQMAQTVANSKVEANLYSLAKDSQNVSASKFWLINKSQDWSDKSTVDFKNVGFGAVRDDDDLAPVIKMVKKKTEEAS